MDKHSNIFNSIGNRNPFTVPKGYFEQFAKEMDAQLAISENRKRKRKHLRIWISAAAMFVAVITAGGFSYNNHQKQLAYEQEFYETYLMAQINENSLIDFVLDGVDN